MKKQFLLFLLSLVCIKNIQGQIFSDEIIQTHGTNIFNINCGYGGITNGLKKVAIPSNSSNALVKPGIQYGLSYERFIFDKIGIGGEVNSGTTTISFMAPDSKGNDMYDYKYVFTTVRAIFRATYHFIESEDFDVYAFGGAGYKFDEYKVSSSDKYEFQKNISKTSHVALKAGIGGRFFFTNNFGFNIEAAIGNPYISAGVSYKFLEEKFGGNGFTIDGYDDDDD